MTSPKMSAREALEIVIDNAPSYAEFDSVADHQAAQAEYERAQRILAALVDECEARELPGNSWLPKYNKRRALERGEES